ncbi:MAG: diguanylate cyclase, partial [Geminicoccaceae bacterium]
MSRPLADLVLCREESDHLAGVVGEANATRVSEMFAGLDAGGSGRCRIESPCGSQSVELAFEQVHGRLASGMATNGQDGTGAVCETGTNVLLQRIFDILPLEISIKCARTRRYIYFNRSSFVPEAARRDDRIGLSPEDIMLPEQARRIRMEDDRLLSRPPGDGPCPAPIVHIAESNGKCFRSTRRLLRDGCGEPEFIVASSEDVTDLIRAGRERDRSVAMLHRAEMLAGLASACVDLDGNRVRLSPNLLTLLGMDPNLRISRIEELFGVFAGRDGRRLREKARLAMETVPQDLLTPVDADLVFRDGRVGHFEIAFHIERDTDSRATGLHVIFRDMTERRLAEAGIRQLAYFDQLTGLANRTRFAAVLEETIAVRSIDDRPIAVALLDLDGFKEVNDRFGHQMGDRVLQVF